MRKVTDPEVEGPSREGRTLADSQPQGAKRIVRLRPKPHPKEKAASPKNNLLTGGRAEQVDLEADLRLGEYNEENQEPPTTRSFSEDHPVRGRKSSHRPRYKTPAGRSRAGYPRQPQTRSKGHGGNPEPQHGTGKNTGGS